ncbi:MAG: hypothetical protein OM95_11200 [Bdellovibrio sp. ArHS]|uniref:hypothetical protein n=1 Tax=Bdellovibrio sp. ArHS TaxID=1569284 RepID=UPI0005833FF7|nr:hypothetical protein [Bdellovibrio sp. ArHS]KHD88078.1 MAG: hypothetical protein OM95_11200 [Bdellovibrio sp. ArHS]
MRKFYGIFALFVLCFVFGYGHMHFNTDKPPIYRDPAAIRNNFDFSHLRGDKLNEAVKQRLLTGMEFRKTPTGAGIGLGHFVFVNENGEKRLACQEFGTVSISFEAEGVSVAGDKPLMEVEGRCEFSPDMSKINPLNIPIAKIVGERPGDGEFQFNEGSMITVRFTNLPEEWPRTWLLKSVKLVNEKQSEALVIESDEVARYLGHPMVFSW